jgi:putative DNA primase/helicase
VAIVKADRGRYVGACLTIARSYIAHGWPARLNPLPSFEKWSDTVRSPVVWLGRSDPAETIATSRGNDPARLARAEVFSTWAAEVGINESGYLSVELADLAEERNEDSSAWLRPALRNALLSVARYHNGESRIDVRRLGSWLRKASSNIAGGYKLIVNQSDAARPRWLFTRR